ncbi:MAG: orotidine-5'-phosphate decarboxylase [Pyrinomonadaceae bacterium]
MVATKDKLIVAVDVPTAKEASEIINLLSGVVGAFKIGLQLFTSAGSKFVKKLVEDNVKIFLDVKYHDIPVTVANAAVEATRLGVWMFNIHASGGSEMIRRTVGEVTNICEAERIQKPKIIGVTVLTSSNRQTLLETGINGDVQSQVLKLALLSAEHGLDGVVASPNETALIKSRISKGNFVVVTPGVRMSDVKDDDQKRIQTPVDAIKNGSDFIVVGRPILHAPDPLSAAISIIESIEIL